MKTKQLAPIPNQQKRDRALNALYAYGHEGTLEEDITDLITDLLHLHAATGIANSTIEQLLEKSVMHFEAEKQGE
jgi:hypothetical protein